MMDILKEYWAIIMTAIGYVLWLGRLESRANTNTREIEKLEARLEKQRAEDMEYNRSHRQEVKDTLQSIQSDIKLLLQRRD
jgi:Flp pilus assembly protein TadB